MRMIKLSHFGTLTKITLLPLSVLLLMGFQNCSKANFSSSDSSSSTNDASGLVHSPSSCQAQLQQATAPIKLLFVVDMSGSNYTNPGTDPDKSVRAGSIQRFYDDYKAKSNFGWGFIGFQGTSAYALINNGSRATARFSDASSMQTAINTFDAWLDSDNTPYRAALNMAYSAIAADTGAASTTKYVVVFLSDGLATDYANNSSGTSQLQSDVQSVVGLLPGRITFNTVYYGPTDASASGRLQNMATAGGGRFLDTNANSSGKSFYIDDVINLPGTTCGN